MYSRSSSSLKSYRSLNSLNKILKMDTNQAMERMRLSIKSQFGADFRRFNITVGTGIPYPTIEEFIGQIQEIHKLTDEQRNSTTISYLSKDGTTLPISNDDNLRKALEQRPTTLRILVRNKGESLEEQFGYGIPNSTMEKQRKKSFTISSPQDFRRVGGILDADTLPLELRRVQLCKTYSNKPLGFFIRDGSSIRLTQWGAVPVPAIFISRLLPNGLAASTNLLNINDEILEVNGIDLSGKTLDQVTDIMTANSANLILTIRPSMMTPYPYFPYQAPPPYHMAAPGYCSPSLYHPPNAFHPQQFYSNLAFHGGENIPEQRHRIPSPLNWGSFSRDSTYRLSDKISKMSLRSNEIRDQSIKERRRPFSVHYPPTHQMYPVGPNHYSYSTYGC